MPASAVVATVVDQPAGNKTSTVLGALSIVAVWMVYEVAMVAFKGQTFGKMFTRIKVIQADNNESPKWTYSLVRWASPAVCVVLAIWVAIGLVLTWLIYLSAVWNKNQQGWHDKAAKTFVVVT